jgi:hypothetical protein
MPARWIRIALLACPALAVGRAAHAQNTVPVELVRALVATPISGPAGPVIVAGRAPDAFPAGVVPAGARVLGGVVRDSTSMAVVAASPLAPDQALASATETLVQAGWTAPGRASEPHGFVDVAARTFSFLCRGTEMVAANAVPATGGGAWVRYEYTSGRRMNGCAALGRRTTYREPWEGMPMPALTAPAGARQMRTGTSNAPDLNGGVAGSTTARLAVDMAPAALLAHYAAQIQAAGWTPSAPVTSAEFGGQSFRFRDASGKAWFGVLSATAIPDSRMRDVEFYIASLPAAETP